MSDSRTSASASRSGALAVLLAALCLGCVAPPAARPNLAAPTAENPFRDVLRVAAFDSHASRTANAWRTSRPADAAALEKVASQPTALWLGDWYPAIEDAVSQIVAGTGASGTPVLVLYNLPLRDCGLHAQGGAASAAAYRQWVDGVARGIGARRAILVVEPDGLAQLASCLDPREDAERLALIRYAVARLAALPGTTLYVDAGHSAWVPAETMAWRLRRAGIERAAGFALNVSNYRATEELMEYGRELSRLVGGKHFVIDTSRNGNGPPRGLEPADERNWCNPGGRALGSPPTIHTGEPLCDAFYWIKAPGESDGPCGQGPTAGAWWPERALELSRNAKW